MEQSATTFWPMRRDTQYFNQSECKTNTLNQSEWMLKTTANQKREQPALCRLGVEGDAGEEGKGKVQVKEGRGFPISLWDHHVTKFSSLLCFYHFLE